MGETKTLADQLREAHWWSVRLPDFRSAEICPTCSSLVPDGNILGTDRSHREQHILSLHSD